jgi:uncharacterized protein
VSRPRKCRKVCSMPERKRFGPLDLKADDDSFVVMAIDEYESIRLIDQEGYNQEECAAQMNVGRTTIQGIYNGARKKLAEAIIKGKVLRIEGGDFMICEKSGASCGGRCRRHGQEGN